jgi:hypothetical protein
MSIKDKLITISQNMPRVYDAGVAQGKVNERDAFWDAYQNYGNRRNYQQAFYSQSTLEGWTDDAYNPKYPIISGAYAFNNTFVYSGITDTKVAIDLSLATSASTSFGNCYKLITVRDLTLPQKVGMNVTNMFLNCGELLNINIVGEIVVNALDLHWSTKLTKASITNIIEHLSPTTTDLTVTLSKVAKEVAFTTDEWAELIATKSNWTIALS